MTPNLPPALAQLIAPIFHAEAATIYAASVEPLIASHVAQAKDEMCRVAVACFASYGLVDPPAQDAPAAPTKQHIIAAGERGDRHDQYVATFRAKYPSGERELCNMIERFPGGTKLNRPQMDAIKRHFGMGTRSLLLPPMMREIGCRDDGSGEWTTPVLRLVNTGNF
jgi:hypothetical protein